ncbi:zinc-binding alcohol dehydrogenase family protein [Amnibacterium endophyticum]|uniref:Zinc-binding alcohol dehydrogenase family protein n=1 Tax=Amnibacterium endophyticum TaxID=2109337 RepID=A0ABW4LHE5_9MICO
MPENRAAWIRSKHARLEVGPAPYPQAAADQVVIRSRAVALNPLEWIIQVDGNITYRWLHYPTVIGSDVAGEVVEVGTDVTRFRVGDRVLAHTVGTDKDSNRPAEGAFQHYPVALERLTCPIPDDLTFEEAATLPLAVSTASSALFQQDQLGLRAPGTGSIPSGQTLLVWGGSTSVGSQAIQLAVAAGYEVIATASPRNFDHVRSLGAAEVFDYRADDVESAIITAFTHRRFAGALALGTTSAPACVRIAGAAHGDRKVAIGTPPVDFAVLASDRLTDRIALTARLVRATIPMQVTARRLGVRARFIFGTSLKNNDVSTAVYQYHLPAALAEHRHAISPRPEVVGHDLQDIQTALDLQRRGVSAAKLVVTL